MLDNQLKITKLAKKEERKTCTEKKSVTVRIEIDVRMNMQGH